MQFRRLLNANDKALKTMSEMETVLSGDKPFGMSFIRSRCALLFVNVYQIIQHLDGPFRRPAPGLARHLRPPAAGHHALAGKRAAHAETALVLDLREIDRTHAEAAGVKMASLGDIAKTLGVTVPAGFVISAAAYHRFMAHQRLQEEINQRIQSHDGENLDQLYELSSVLQQLVMGATVPEDVAAAIQQAVAALKARAGGPLSLAVRSSGVNEDLPGASFAGQYRSLLNVHPDHVVDAFKEVVASKFGMTAMAYRFHRGLRDEDIVMCVGCLQMVDAVSGGVLYTRNPLDIRDDTIIINAVWGLPKMVVDGRSAVDQFVISRHPPHAVRARKIGAKTVGLPVPGTGGHLPQRTDGGAGPGPLHRRPPGDGIGPVGRGHRSILRPAPGYRVGHRRPGPGHLIAVPPVEHRPGPGCAATPAPAQAAATDADAATFPVVLQGQITASGGVRAGPVRLLKREADTLQFADGEVMVIQQSLPGFAILLNRAAAVIAEYGSISSHLANVAREYRVPALFGAEGAMARLQNGRVVTVDADALKVYANHSARCSGAGPGRPT
jgi:pyruvate, water dikinase